MNEDAFKALLPFVETLKKHGLEYRLTGSLASTILGIGRTTFDVDVVSNLNAGHVAALQNDLEQDYLADEVLMQQSLEQGQAFNLIHPETMLKLDVFPIQNREYSRVAFARYAKTEDELFLLTPEDLILAKLEWIVAGDQTSIRQWQDVLGIVGIQKERLDVGYMRHWANDLGLSALLEKVLNEI